MVSTLTPSASTMVATDDLLDAAAASAGVTIDESRREAQLDSLKDVDTMCQKVLSMPDYYPENYVERYPRTQVEWPSKQKNELRGWAWKAKVKGPSKGLLSGKTLCLKDNICLAEVPVTYGTEMLKDYLCTIDAELVKRALDHGVKILGKATCESFSHGPGSNTSFYGPVENPFAHGFSAGGSSSGCGALVGGHICDMGMGGDQGGSVRIPASLCGVVGLKPTFGLIPYTGVISSEWGIDTVGPMTTTVEDCARLLEATAGYDGIDDRQLGAPEISPPYHQNLISDRALGVNGVRIGVLVEGFTHPALDTRVERLVRMAIKDFETLGATVVPVSAPLHTSAAPICGVLSKFGGGPTRLGRANGSRGFAMTEVLESMLPWTQEKFELAGRYLISSVVDAEYGWDQYPLAYPRAVNQSRALRDQFDRIFQDVDVLVMPTIQEPARRHAPQADGPRVWQNWSPGITYNTAVFNATRHPAMSIPVGMTSPVERDILTPEDKAIKLPVGMQIVAKRFNDAMCLRVGDAWERNVDWRSRYLQ